MSYNKWLIFLGILAAAGVAAFVIGAAYRQERQDSDAAVATAASGKSSDEYMAEKIAAMSLDEKIGTMMMVAIPGTMLAPETSAWLRTHHIGGVILLGPNIRTREQTIQLIRDLQHDGRNAKDPTLFIAVDQEGGSVSRFRFLKELTAQSDVADNARATAIARERGSELKELGVNINFSPVLDVASSSADFIYSRAFRGDAMQVATLAGAMVRGYQEAGIISVAKHFPGHGGTAIDSHKNLPTVSRNASATADALLPFRSAVKENMPIVMMGHIKVPEIDDKYPASLSPAAINMLRSDIGFKGVVITDDLGMGAITRSYALPDAAVRSIKVGTDIVLAVRATADYNKIYAALIQAVRRGDISETRINQSVMRILVLKEEYLKGE